MIFNQDPNKNDICNFADGLIDTNNISFPLVKKAMYATLAEKIIMQTIWLTYGGWRYDDLGYNTLPTSVGTLNAGQVLYRLPVEANTIFAAYYSDLQGNSYPLKAITREQIIDRGYTVESFMNVPGNPAYYMPDADTVSIFPAASFTNPTGLELEFDRDVIGFTASSTTQTPGFESRFHEAVPTFMAWTQAKIKGKKNKNDLGGDWIAYVGNGVDEFGSIGSYYKKKFRQAFPPVINKGFDASLEYANNYRGPGYGGFN